MSDFDVDRTRIVPRAFFERPSALVARELLGAVLVSRVGDAVAAGVIVETEAYLGSDDPGSHAATRGITARNRVMYGPPGYAYVYFTYGNHYMLNLVTEPEGVAGAVLIRAIRPVVGVEVMSSRRGGRLGLELTSGPGKLTAALGVDLSHNATELGGLLAVYEGAPEGEARVGVSGRVGLRTGYDLPLRFYVQDDRYVSKGRTGPPRRSHAAAAQRKGTE